MKYRHYGSSNMRVSEIGLGGEYLEGKSYECVKSTVDAAFAAGINILDCFMSEPEVRTNLGRALRGRRDQMAIQGHFRAIWKNGQYGRTLDAGETELFFTDLLERLETNYIDIGMLHMVDNDKDLEAIQEGGILEYALQLKEKGVIKKLGMSSRNSETALKAVKAGLLDGLMLSVSPAYDLIPAEETSIQLTKETLLAGARSGMDPVRAALYRECEMRGVAITTMKTFGAGLLLDARSSPFGVSMSIYQCIHYALTRPAVASAMLGMQTAQEVMCAAGYDKASAQEKDYTKILTLSPAFSAAGQCVYCNHCLPCPAGLNIGQINKYLDLAEMGGVSPTLQGHYDSLPHQASECLHCATCEKSCPFGVKIVRRMKRAVAVFETKKQ